MSTATSIPCPKIVVIIPTYGAFDYARLALVSLYRYTPESVLSFVLDDGSKDWHKGLYSGIADDSVVSKHYTENNGLTAMWNLGIGAAYGLKSAEYIVVTNSDILFTPYWWEPLVTALNSGYDLVGPVSNAPGVTSKGVQQVDQWLYHPYAPTADVVINELAATELRRSHGDKVVPSNINGFFMMAKAKTWKEIAHKYPMQTFPSRILFMPSGRINLSPCMTGQEDWACAKLTKMGRKIGAVPGSFIVHFRSVTRGEKHATGRWFRHNKETANCW